MRLAYGERTAEVSHAVVLIAVQADCSRDEALALLNQRANLFDQPVGQLADAVIERRLRFGLSGTMTRSPGQSPVADLTRFCAVEPVTA